MEKYYNQLLFVGTFCVHAQDKKELHETEIETTIVRNSTEQRKSYLQMKLNIQTSIKTVHYFLIQNAKNLISYICSIIRTYFLTIQI
jgi:hypothetical protein